MNWLERHQGPIAVSVALVLTTAMGVLQATQVDVKWTMAPIATALVFLILQTRKTPQIAAEIASIRSEHAVRVFATEEDYFEEAARRVRQATDTILATMLRNGQPPTSRTADRYFDELIKWARASSSHVVVRVVPVRAADRSMQDWIDRREASISGIPNYQQRRIDWSTKADGINMIVIDDVCAFLLISGQKTQMRGLMTDDRSLVRYLRTYHESLCAAADVP